MKKGGIRFSPTAPKYKNKMAWWKDTVGQHSSWIILHTRLSRKFFYYAAKYAQRVHDVIPVKDLCDKEYLPSTPYQLAPNQKSNVRKYRVVGYPAIFKRYKLSDKGKRIKKTNTYNKV